MKKHISLLLSSLLFASFSYSDNSSFTSLFNGKNLDGWKGMKEVWSVKDGVIHSANATSKNWLIWEDGKTKNFELKLKTKFTYGNSGVQVRSKEIEPFMVQGYQMEIAQGEKMGLWHHSLLPKEFKHRSHLSTAGQKVHIAKDGQKTVEQVTPPEEVQKAWKENEWNELTIIAKGPNLKQYVNGVLLSDLTDLETNFKSREGLLALQNHGKKCIVEFKDIQIRHID